MEIPMFTYIYSLKKRAFLIFAFTLLLSAYTNAQTKTLVVKEIRILGNVHTKESLVRSEISTKKKHVYSEEKINEDIRAILATGKYEDAQVELIDDEDGVVVVYNVKERPYITKMDFQGNDTVKTQKLKSKIESKINGSYNAVTLTQDEAKITDYYREKGYVDAKIESYTDVNEDTNEAVITIYISEGKKVLIKKVVFQGVTAFKQKKLFRLLKTKRNKVYKEDVFQMDMEKVKFFYKNKGYLKVEIGEPEMVLDAEREFMTLVITVKEGMRYKVGNINFEGNTIFSKDDFAKEVVLKTGQMYGEENFQRSLQGIHDMYAERGYIRSSIDPEFIYNEEQNVVDFKFSIIENGIVYIDRIYIEGNDVTKDYVVRKQLVIKEGDSFNVKKVRRSQEQIYNLGFFQDVQIDVDENALDSANLAFIVDEQKTGMASVGAGYSSQDGMLGTIQVSQINFAGRAQKLNFMWEFGEKRQNYQISFTDPYFLRSDTSFGIDIFNTNRSREYVYIDDYGFSRSDWYTEERVGGRLRLGKKLSDIYTAGMSYSREQVRVSDVSDDASSNHLALIEQQDQGTQKTNTLAVSGSRDTRDNVFDPSRGAKTNLSLELAGSFLLGGHTNFTKITTAHSFFIPTFWKFVIGFNCQAGLVSHFYPSNDVPIYEKFYVGGAESVRGYDYRGDIGPGSGGNYMFVYNVEYKFPIVQESNHTILQGAFFLDVGGMWDNQKKITLEIGRRENDMRAGVGFGVRFKTPVFPIRLDWGYGLNQREGKHPSQFYFTIGQLF
ncbi:MAG: outer membrane protein assembly factor BamA [Elusimicrobiota bacterium]